MFRMLLLSAIITAGWAHEHEHQIPVVPKAEHATDAAVAVDGPTEHVGISVAAVGAVLLADVPELSDRQIRVREVTIAPGGNVAVHEHTDRPGFAYILSGEAIEHRPGAEGARVFGPGMVAFEKDGIVHWWENHGEEPVRALVVDLIKVE